MHDPAPSADRRPVIVFKAGCPPCQWMSRLAVILSVGAIRRVALEAEEAQRLYARHPQATGQIVLLYRDRMSFGRPVFAALPGVVLRHWLSPLTDRWARVRPAASDGGAS